MSYRLARVVARMVVVTAFAAVSGCASGEPTPPTEADPEAPTASVSQALGLCESHGFDGCSNAQVRDAQARCGGSIHWCCVARTGGHVHFRCARNEAILEEPVY